MLLCNNESLKKSDLAPCIIKAVDADALPKRSILSLEEPPKRPGKKRLRRGNDALYYHRLDIKKVISDASYNDDSPETLACHVLLCRLLQSETIQKLRETKIRADERSKEAERKGNPSGNFTKIVTSYIHFGTMESHNTELLFERIDPVLKDLKEEGDIIKYLAEEEYPQSKIRYKKAKYPNTRGNPSTEMENVVALEERRAPRAAAAGISVTI